MVADLMTSRWAYEVMAVHQFKNNEFEKAYFNYERAEAVADYKAAYLADELITRNQYLLDLPETPSDTAKAKRSRHILFTELRNEPYREGIENLDLEAVFTPAGYSKTTGEQIEAYLSRYKKYYQKEYNHYAGLIEKKMAFYEQQGINIQQEKNKYYNESLADLVRNVTTKERISEYQDALIQNINPVFQSPNPSHRLDYRAPFFIAEKNLAGWPVSTYFFNLLMIWGMSSVFFVALYFQWLRKFVGLFGKINLTLKK